MRKKRGTTAARLGPGWLGRITRGGRRERIDGTEHDRKRTRAGDITMNTTTAADPEALRQRAAELEAAAETAEAEAERQRRAEAERLRARTARQREAEEAAAKARGYEVAADRVCDAAAALLQALDAYRAARSGSGPGIALLLTDVRVRWLGIVAGKREHWRERAAFWDKRAERLALEAEREERAA